MRGIIKYLLKVTTFLTTKSCGWQNGQLSLTLVDDLDLRMRYGFIFFLIKNNI
jgi:hypothetical protein